MRLLPRFGTKLLPAGRLSAMRPAGLFRTVDLPMASVDATARLAKLGSLIDKGDGCHPAKELAATRGATKRCGEDVSTKVYLHTRVHQCLGGLSRRLERCLPRPHANLASCQPPAALIHFGGYFLLGSVALTLTRVHLEATNFAHRRRSLLSFDLQRRYYIKNVVLFEENSILPLPECFEASGVKSVWGEVSQESPKNPEKSGKIGLVRAHRRRESQMIRLHWG